MITKRDLAKYPFTDEARKYVEGLRIKMDELANKEFDEALALAEKRIEDSINNVEKKEHHWKNDDIELLSFSASLIILSHIKDERVKNRYALVESKKAFKNFKREDNFSKILKLAENSFRWNVREKVINNEYGYELFFPHFLRNSVKIMSNKWKLTNRTISQGYVKVSREEICRLLQEEVREKILKNIHKPKGNITSLQTVIKKVEKTILPAIVDSYPRDYASLGINETAFPPCIKNQYEILKTGGNLSHIGRFTLTSFLINIGVGEKKMLEIFKEVMDFDERKTIYQIEHIAGMRGSKTKYLPPKCGTLKTHGICIKPDQICSEIRKPIDYYIKKMRGLSKKKT